MLASVYFRTKKLCLSLACKSRQVSILRLALSTRGLHHASINCAQQRHGTHCPCTSEECRARTLRTRVTHPPTHGHDHSHSYTATATATTNMIIHIVTMTITVPSNVIVIGTACLLCPHCRCDCLGRGHRQHYSINIDILASNMYWMSSHIISDPCKTRSVRLRDNARATKVDKDGRCDANAPMIRDKIYASSRGTCQRHRWHSSTSSRRST